MPHNQYKHIYSIFFKLLSLPSYHIISFFSQTTSRFSFHFLPHKPTLKDCVLYILVARELVHSCSNNSHKRIHNLKIQEKKNDI